MKGEIQVFDQMSDGELMRLIQNRNLDALKELYKRYERLLFSLAMKVLSNSQEAEEVVQDVWLKVWNKSELFDPRKQKKFSSWIIRVCFNTALDKLKKRKVDYYLDIENLDDIPNCGVNLDREMDLQTLKFCVKQALQKLPEEQRLIIELIYFQGYSQAEVAEHMGIPLGTVKSRTRLAMTKIKRVLYGEGGECRCDKVRADLKNYLLQ